MTTSTAVAGHSYRVDLEVQDLPPVNGCAVREQTGLASMVCECGVTVTGPASEVRALAAVHQGRHAGEADCG